MLQVRIDQLDDEFARGKENHRRSRFGDPMSLGPEAFPVNAFVPGKIGRRIWRVRDDRVERAWP